VKRLRDAKLHVAVLGAIVVLGTALAACQEPGAASPPASAERTQLVGEGEIEVWKDPNRPVVCYVWSGYHQNGGISCVVGPTR
jgi:hypothetical protein